MSFVGFLGDSHKFCALAGANQCADLLIFEPASRWIDLVLETTLRRSHFKMEISARVQAREVYRVDEFDLIVAILVRRRLPPVVLALDARTVWHRFLESAAQLHRQVVDARNQHMLIEDVSEVKVRQKMRRDEDLARVLNLVN